MTTTVKILIEGNKACEVYVSNGPDSPPDAPITVKPGTFTTKLIHGDKYVVVKEVGEFVS
jgi:hypothetical protein